MRGEFLPRMDATYASFFCQNCGQAIQLDQSILVAGMDQPAKDYRGHLSQRLSVADKLFRIITKESKIEQPMCDECAQELLEHLERKLTEQQLEKDQYENYLSDLKEMNRSSPDSSELKSVLYSNPARNS
jgi:hypothetical protein